LNSLLADLKLENELGGLTEGFTEAEIPFNEMFGDILNGQLGAVVYEESMAEGGLNSTDKCFRWTW